ncbi:beta-glucan synthesis-associated [Clavulina sp. PMI_390]|nr:beta-glucan synthesis-associated [Clavulina sp. PMI_390]
MEYYDPSAISTRDGSLIIQLSQEENHGLDYKSGHLTSWNKLCLTGGYVEVNVSLPGPPSLAGFWPAVWMMGNLGRAGYGATTEGLWPYSYDTCDWGTLPGQVFPSPTDPNAQPSAALTTGPGGGVLSGAPGQRFSACTCGNANDGDGPMGHPGPKRGDGFVGRMAPEIDILEASSFNGIGTVSQSLQVAPFNAAYNWSQDSSDLSIYDSTTILNSYKGGVYQESISAVSDTNQNGYESTGGYSTFGIEYEPGSDGYITWFSNGSPTWTVYPSAFGPDSQTNISQRLVSPEPMYLIMNLGYSHGFGAISPNLPFPATMSIDYIRIYQNPSNSQNTQLSCNPPGYPTEQYINDYIQIYTDPNITSFSGTQAGSFGATVPKNRLVDTC